MVEIRSRESGITLLALVVTVIVLLILVGVTLFTMLSENGILNQAQNANDIHIVSEEKEIVDLAYVYCRKRGNVDRDNVERAIRSMDYDDETVTVTNGEEDFVDKVIIRFNDTNNIFTLDEYGNVDSKICIIEYVANGGTGTIEHQEVEGSVVLSDGTGFNGRKTGYTIVKWNTKADGTGTYYDLGQVIDDLNSSLTLYAIWLPEIPDEFYYVGGTIDTGVVISDNKDDDNVYAPWRQENDKLYVGTELQGNQFVWVPCTTSDTGESGITKYAQNTTYNTNYQNLYNNKSWSEDGENTDSVSRYGGFYIGRYEAGWPSGGTANSPYITDGKNVSSGKPIFKANSVVWNYINQANAKTVSSNMYSKSSSVTSSLIDSYAWDTTCQWFIDSGKVIENSNSFDCKSYGNYSNAYNTKLGVALYASHKHISGDKWYPATNYEQNNLNDDLYLGGTNPNISTRYLLEIATGSIEDTKINNIYDMAGNLWEFTTEYRIDSGNQWQYVVYRGGSFFDEGGTCPIVFRSGDHTKDRGDILAGFRVVLYLK